MQLVAIRKDILQLTQKEMAKKIGVSSSYYTQIELGQRNPSYNFLVKFKSIYPDLDISEIFFDH